MLFSGNDGYRPMGLQQRRDDEAEEHSAILVNALERMERTINDTLRLARERKTVDEMDDIRAVGLIGSRWAAVETRESILELDDEFTVYGAVTDSDTCSRTSCAAP